MSTTKFIETTKDSFSSLSREHDRYFTSEDKRWNLEVNDLTPYERINWHLDMLMNAAGDRDTDIENFMTQNWSKREFRLWALNEKKGSYEYAHILDSYREVEEFLKLNTIFDYDPSDSINFSYF